MSEDLKTLVENMDDDSRERLHNYLNTKITVNVPKTREEWQERKAQRQLTRQNELRQLEKKYRDELWANKENLAAVKRICAKYRRLGLRNASYIDLNRL